MLSGTVRGGHSSFLFPGVRISVIATTSPFSSAAKGKDPSRLCVCVGLWFLPTTLYPCESRVWELDTQATLANPECCPHCSLFTLRVLEHRVRVTAVTKGEFLCASRIERRGCSMVQCLNHQTNTDLYIVPPFCSYEMVDPKRKELGQKVSPKLWCNIM